ncbi:MAG TPA: HAD-IA family hydrolase [Actinomycetota bacterium]|nr:HAD-IA family hydrolase [Actinomycetota bacterium]
MPLQAVIFDVDGTIAETERHGHRVAFNRAFEEHGLPYRWDPEPYGELLAQPGGERRLEKYLLAAGHPAEEASELATSLHKRKQQLFLAIVREGAIPLRNGIARLVDELVAGGIAVGVATTAGRVWVIELLELLLGDERMSAVRVIVTGEDVSALKPDPEVYLKALAGLGCDAGQALAIEDSAAGMRSAKAAGLACLVVRNGYTTGHDFTGADLVVDDLDESSIDLNALRQLRESAP